MSGSPHPVWGEKSRTRKVSTEGPHMWARSDEVTLGSWSEVWLPKRLSRRREKAGLFPGSDLRVFVAALGLAAGDIPSGLQGAETGVTREAYFRV